MFNVFFLEYIMSEAMVDSLPVGMQWKPTVTGVVL